MFLQVCDLVHVCWGHTFCYDSSWHPVEPLINWFNSQISWRTDKKSSATSVKCVIISKCIWKMLYLELVSEETGKAAACWDISTLLMLLHHKMNQQQTNDLLLILFISVDVINQVINQVFYGWSCRNIHVCTKNCCSTQTCWTPPPPHPSAHPCDLLSNAASAFPLCAHCVLCTLAVQSIANTSSSCYFK